MGVCRGVNVGRDGGMEGGGGAMWGRIQCVGLIRMGMEMGKWGYEEEYGEHSSSQQRG